MDKQIVISRYKEDVGWTSQIKHDFIIYNKSGLFDLTGEHVIDLPNFVWRPGRVGREADTYLHHIISNWGKLADQTTFIQGHPFDHCDNMIEYLNDDVVTDFRGFKNLIRHTLDGSLRKVWKIIFGEALCSDHIVSYQGAQFEVSKELIYSRGKQFYLDLYNNTILNCEIGSWPSAFFMETVWIDIFLYNNPQFEDVYKKLLKQRIEFCMGLIDIYWKKDKDVLMSRVNGKLDEFNSTN